MDEMSGLGKVVAVTGSSGYIASWLVKRLLERGYTVKASVRNLDDTRKTQHLLSLDGAKERLHLFEADLLIEGSFDTLVHGCHGVFHTASPVSFHVTNPQEELLEPAVKGTANVLRSCVKSLQSIKRVILTSSLAAVAHNQHVKPGVTVDETWFSDSTYCQDRKLWYMLSKTLAEDGAWKFAKEHGIDMVVINPGLVIGPLLQPDISFSQTVILNLLNTGGGEALMPNLNMQWVDVRDVCESHILAFEIPQASGRYCLAERTAHLIEVINILRQLYPTLPLPIKCEESVSPFSADFNVSRKKAESLGIKFLPFEATLKDTVDSLLEMNLLKPLTC